MICPLSVLTQATRVEGKTPITKGRETTLQETYVWCPMYLAFISLQRGDNAKQFVKITKTVTGVSLKNGQTNLGRETLES
jgi:hypothetical protein